MGDQWEISTGNGVVITNKICKACNVELCGRKLEADMFVLDTGGYDVILGMTCVTPRFHGYGDVTATYIRRSGEAPTYIR